MKTSLKIPVVFYVYRAPVSIPFIANKTYSSKVSNYLSVSHHPRLSIENKQILVLEMFFVSGQHNTQL